jgi:hypothetical protein
MQSPTDVRIIGLKIQPFSQTTLHLIALIKKEFFCLLRT